MSAGNARAASRLLLAVMLFLLTLPAGVAAQTETPEMLRGINVVYSGGDGADPAAVERLLDHLESMHVDTILLTIPIYVDAWQATTMHAVFDGDDINPNANTPTDDELNAIIAPAIARGIAVMIRPLLDERNLIDTGPANAWRGNIEPADPDRLFADLRRLLLDQAAAARENGASWLVIGTELNSLENDRYSPYWDGIIRDLRDALAGSDVQLTYAQNWDTGKALGYPAWFSLLDAISVDAYFPASNGVGDPTPEDVRDALNRWQPDLQALKEAAGGIPLFITEAGVASQQSEPSVLERPWAWPDPALPTDIAIQATYINGACQSFRGMQTVDGQPLATGIFWWMTSVIALPDPMQDNSFEVVGKPAQQEIARCYSD